MQLLASDIFCCNKSSNSLNSAERFSVDKIMARVVQVCCIRMFCKFSSHSPLRHLNVVVTNVLFSTFIRNRERKLNRNLRLAPWNDL